jgi:hypothetical protein
MTATRKPRPESVLKNLPINKQAQIAERLRKTSLRAAVIQLRREGIQTSRQALGRFLAWWNERQREENLLKAAGEAVEKVRKENPEISAAELSDRARQLFIIQALAMLQTDKASALKLWIKLQRRIST